MKTSIVRFVITVAGLAIILVPEPASARQKRQRPPKRPDQRLVDSLLDANGYAAYAHLPGYPSASRAAYWSLGATFIPIAAGALVYALQTPQSHEIYNHNGQYIGRNTTDPDRTLPYVLIAAGVFAGPSAGYFYGGLHWRGLGGIVFRTGFALAVGFAASGVATSKSSNVFADYSGVRAGLSVAFIGGVFVVFQAIYDLAHVHAAVTRNNCERANQSLALLPVVSGDGRPGIHLSLRF